MQNHKEAWKPFSRTHSTNNFNCLEHKKANPFPEKQHQDDRQEERTKIICYSDNFSLAPRTTQMKNYNFLYLFKAERQRERRETKKYFQHQRQEPGKKFFVCLKFKILARSCRYLKAYSNIVLSNWALLGNAREGRVESSHEKFICGRLLWVCAREETFNLSNGSPVLIKNNKKVSFNGELICFAWVSRKSIPRGAPSLDFYAFNESN